MSQGIVPIKRCVCGRKKHSNRGRPRSNGILGEIWDWKTHTERHCTDAFGEVQFYRYGMKPSTAKYLRVNADAQSSRLLTLLSEYWGIKDPSLVISIIADGDDEYAMSRTARISFCNNLASVARNAAAYIVTSGYHIGMLKIITKALNRNLNSNGEGLQKDIPVVGISTWGSVLNRELLQSQVGHGCYPAKCVAVRKAAGRFLPLDPFHTHFILADDGTIGQRKAEEILRQNLENELLRLEFNGGKVPMIQIVISGDERTLVKVNKSLQRRIPVLVVEETDGAATILTLVKESCKLQLDYLEQRICEKFGWNIAEKHTTLRTKLQDCLLNIKEIRTNIDLLFTYNRMEDQLGDIIFDAVVYARRLDENQSAQLKIMWNKIDEGAGADTWEKIDSDVAMENALLGEREDIVEFLIKEKHGLNLYHFVTPQRLQDLYLSAPEDSLLRLFISKTIRQHHGDEACRLIFSCPFESLKLLKMRMLNSLGMGKKLLVDNRKSSRYEELSYVGKAIADLMGHDYDNPYTEERLRGSRSKILGFMGSNEKYQPSDEDDLFELLKPDDGTYFDDPCRELFLWAVLTDRYKLSMVLWKRVNYAIAGALVAANILLRMSESTLVIKNPKVVQKLQDRGRKFIKLALGVIQDCYAENRQDAVLAFMQELPNWGNFSCFAIVFASSRMQDIIVHDCYQDSLNYLWTGEILTETPMWKVLACTFCPPLIFTDFVKFKPHADLNSFQRRNNILNDAEKMASQEDLERAAAKICEERELNQSRNVVDKFTDQLQVSKFNILRLEKFYTAPRMIFLLNLFTYVAFLAAYAIFIMTRFRDEIRPVEIILIIWVSALVMEEIRQIIFAPKARVTDKVDYWWSDHWNKTDVLAASLFYTAVVLRNHTDTEEVGRLLYCVDFIIFFLRLLQMLSIRVNLGPKMAMIRHMVRDLISFIIILFVFLTAFGIATQAILYPIDVWDGNVVKNIFYVPYYRIYGELFLDENYQLRDMYINRNFGNFLILNDELNYELAFKCRSLTNATTQNRAIYNCAAGDAIVHILVVIYLLLTTILLLNLLIAIFNNTYGKIEDDATQIWRIQYNNLLREYLFRSPSVPPLNYLPILYTLLPWNWRTTAESWKRFLKQLANLKHLKIPRKKFEVYDVCRLQYWEREKQLIYLGQLKTDKQEIKGKGKWDKWDICLSRMGELAKEIRSLKKGHLDSIYGVDSYSRLQGLVRSTSKHTSL
ncbi:Transient receptor potential cation channel subfamily M member 3 [Trichoplax sp. H2]|nr:Transient receptor potential cation channel subfamily M member 3 [Trichoplax sp. H2]|eukprot:RDD38222.1 Transient receptor potential cation channel subfamily M member 3 [Trichoplax sp. H2]